MEREREPETEKEKMRGLYLLCQSHVPWWPSQYIFHREMETKTDKIYSCQRRWRNPAEVVKLKTSHERRE